MLRRPIDIAVISDVHLGTYGCHAAELLSYLQGISPQILILNGDIIDGWQFSKRYFPAAHLAVIREILAFVSAGTRVIYVTGNHDEMLRRYADLHIGNFTLTDKYLLEVNGKTMWVFHGDVFDNTTKGSAKMLAKLGGYGYDLLILLNSFINLISKSFGGEKVSFSKKIKNSVKKAITYINKFESIVAELAISKKYDYVICGHIHHPVKKVMRSEKGEVVYLNSGDWIENLSALEYSNDEWSIYFHNDPAPKQSGISKRLPALNVMSEEINYSLNSLAII